MKAKKLFDLFLLLSKSERNGALVILLIIGLLLIVRISLPVIISPVENKKIEISLVAEQPDTAKHSKNSKSFDSKDKGFYKEGEKEKLAVAFDKRIVVKKNIVKEFFQFDPNNVSYEELIQFGFTKSVAKNLINYRSKGGVFRKPEDLKKIYGIDSSFYKNAYPYIMIPKEKVPAVSLEINEADSALLTSLKGIGPVFASRICRYRNQLGGFVSIDQLKEVYKFPIETFDLIKGSLKLDLSKVKKININFAGIDDLKRHPYCKYENARKIVDYRSKNGYLQKIDLLLKNSVIDSFTFRRLSPYLKVE